MRTLFFCLVLFLSSDEVYELQTDAVDIQTNNSSSFNEPIETIPIIKIIMLLNGQKLCVMVNVDE